MTNAFQYVVHAPWLAFEQAAAQFYGDANALERRMERCRVVAHVLDVRRAAIAERCRPVVELHNEAVWRGRAATASREYLRSTTGSSLHFLGLDIAATSRALLEEASMLAREAAVLRRRARSAEAAAFATRRLARDDGNDGSQPR